MLLFIVTVFSGQALVSQKSDAFLVYISDHKLKVVSPVRHSPNLHVILQNQTLSQVKGKIQTEEGRVIDYVSLLPGQSKSVLIGHVKAKKFFYYPMAPAFQEAELVIGRAYYEIPPKK